MDLVNHVKNSIKNACNEKSNIDPAVIALKGETGTHYRHFINNLYNMHNAILLEIAGYDGITACSAVSNNDRGKIFSISNWTAEGIPKHRYILNLIPTIRNAVNIYVDSQYYTIDYDSIFKERVNMYIYHHLHGCYESVIHSLKCTQDTYVYVCNHWNVPFVREGVRRGIRENNITVLFEDEIRLTYDDNNSPAYIAEKTWGNGVYIAVFQKKR